MNRLREIREKKKYTRTRLANEVGVTERYIVFLEEKQREPSLKVAFKIAFALDSTIEDLFLDMQCTKST